MRRLSQSVKSRLFSRGSDSGDATPPIYEKDAATAAAFATSVPPARVSLPKIDLDQVGVYEEDDDSGSGTVTTGRTDSGRSSNTCDSERAPSPVYQQKRLLERRPSTPSPVPLSPGSMLSADALDFKQPHASCGINTPRVVKNIQRLCKAGPSKDDKPGHIYIVQNQRDRQPYFKLQFSTVPLTDNDVFPLKKVCKIAVSKCAFAKELVMLLVDSMRILRYPLDDDAQTYHTYHKKTGQLVRDSMHDMATGKPKLLTKAETEWVMMTQEVLQRIVQQAVLIIDEFEQ